MSSVAVTLDQVLAMARQLPPADQARLVARLAPVVERVLDQTEARAVPSSRPPTRGLLADLGPAPSAEEIDEVRREIWAGYDAE
jgi:hypothetical protein